MSVVFYRDSLERHQLLARGFSDDELRPYPKSFLGPLSRLRMMLLDLVVYLAAVLAAVNLGSAFWHGWTHPELTQMQVLRAVSDWGVPWRWM